MRAGGIIVLGFIVLIVLLLLIAAWVGPKIDAKLKERKARKNEQANWTMHEDGLDNGDTQVVLRKPGEPTKLIGPAVSANLPQWQFEEELIDRRVQAEAKAAALNRRLGA